MSVLLLINGPELLGVKGKDIMKDKKKSEEFSQNLKNLYGEFEGPEWTITKLTEKTRLGITLLKEALLLAEWFGGFEKSNRHVIAIANDLKIKALEEVAGAITDIGTQIAVFPIIMTDQHIVKAVGEYAINVNGGALRVHLEQFKDFIKKSVGKITRELGKVSAT